MDSTTFFRYVHCNAHLPDPPESKRTSRTNKGKSTSQMPKHLSSDQFIEYLTKNEEEKKAAEEEKQT